MTSNKIPLIYTAPAQSISPYIYFGTSSWTHEFWKGQVYHREYKSEKDFNLNSLSEYASLGLFRSVEIDSTFYAPPKEETLQRYAELVPEDFKFTAKVWERISIPVYPNIKRYGKYAGLENDSFLDPNVFVDSFLPEFKNPQFFKKLGSFLIQFPKMEGKFATPKFFLEKLDLFLSAFPKEFPLTIEIRNQGLLTAEYVALLNQYKVTHCFSQWETMYSLIDQMKIIAAAGGLESPFYYARLITPQGVSFDGARKLFEPFYEIKKRDDAARKAIKRIAERAILKNIPAFVIINNRFEGNSPQTICELESLLIS